MLEYTVKTNAGKTYASNALFKYGKVEIGDSAVGIWDTPESFEYLEYHAGNHWWKNFGQDEYNLEHHDMVYYWNFILTNEMKLSQRIRYSLLEVVGEIGGLYEGMVVFMACFFYVYNYKLHEAQMLK